MKKIDIPWSFSRWSAWDQCNAKAGFRYGDKIAEPRGGPLIRGGETHEAIDAYAKYNLALRSVPVGKTFSTKGKIPKLPPHAEFFKKRIDWMIEQGCIFEERWFIDKNGKLVAKRTNLEPRPPKHSYWLEVGTDSYLPPKKTDKVLYIWDFKTGKVRNYDDQKEIYAMAGMIVFPWIEKVICENLYLDAKETSEARFFRDTFDRTWEKWQHEVKMMTADREFKPNPTRLCGWCGYSKFKGGPCQAAQE